jgi:hypothetical protein
MLKSELPHEAPNPVSKKAARVHHAARRRGGGKTDGVLGKWALKEKR